MLPQGADTTGQLSFLLPALLGVVGGGASNILLRVWQYDQDSWSSIAKSTKEALESLGATGAEYWCNAGDKLSDDSEREAKILGLQATVDGLIVCLYDKIHPSSHERLNYLVGRVRTAATGDTFQSSPKQSPINAVLLQTSISDLIVEIQKAETSRTKRNFGNTLVGILAVLLIAIFLYFSLR